MASIIAMPKLSDTMEEGAVASWLKKEGESISEGEDLVEIETDKATMAYQSPVGGVVLQILLQPGKAVPLGVPMVVVGKKGETFDVVALTATQVKAPSATKAKVEEKSQQAAPTSSTTPQPFAVSSSGRVKSSPLARKIAKDKGISLEGLSGSGPAGRIILRDLDKLPSRATGQVFTKVTAKEIPVSLMRKTIAKRLVAGKNDAPHFYLTMSANVEPLLKLRKRLNDQTGKDQAKISLNDLILFTVSRALLRHPNVNASWQGENIVEYSGVHLAVAVALPTGLVTPVIRNAHNLSMAEIAAQAKTLIGKAKDGSLANEDYQGGTFTVSNLGMFGIEEFTAIINPPQAAILAVGAAIAVPVVLENGQIIAQTRMKMTLSCDHRVVDGAMGAAFLKNCVDFLEEPVMMLT